MQIGIKEIYIYMYASQFVAADVCFQLRSVSELSVILYAFFYF